MPRNVEIKAKVTNLNHILDIVKSLTNENGVVLRQKDTFYRCSNGRLKLRSTDTEKEETKSQLIFYRRPDQNGPKLSEFLVTPVSDPEGMDCILSSSLGSDGVVAKKRTLFMVGQTRIHVDEVESLGNFIELEVQLRNDQLVEDGVKIANNLMEKLGIRNDDLLISAYHDMLQERIVASG